MKVLLTGGAGYIGSHTAVELLNRGHEIVIADNYVNSKPEALNRIREITDKHFNFYNIDVCSNKALDILFAKENIDAVIHFAGLKAVGESVSLPLKYYRNNIDSTLALLETMNKYNVNIFIFSSSATVYRDPAGVPITEDMPVGNCSNPYGRTKYMIEQILNDAVNADSNLKVVLLRYFNPIGAHPSGRLCEDPNGIPNNLMPYILKVAAGKCDCLKVFGSDYPTKDGTGVRDYIHVVDLAKGHVAALDYTDKNKGVGIFNLGTGIGYSVLDVVHAFDRISGKTLPYKFAPRRAGDIAECYASPVKAAAGLGWKAELDLDTMCRDSWRAVQMNPDGYGE